MLKKIIFTFHFSFIVFAFSQNGYQKNYLKYLDSADNTKSENPKIAALYLDSIPKPLDKYIEGHLAFYYNIKAFINDKNKESSKRYQNYILAYKICANREKL